MRVSQQHGAGSILRRAALWTSVAFFAVGAVRFILPHLGPHLGFGGTRAGPSLACEAPTYLFGKRYANETVEHSFVLSNVSDSPIEILRVVAGCADCTEVKVDQSLVVPGRHARVDTSFALAGRRGPVSTIVIVVTNAPREPHVALRLEGEVLP
jgi:hypothetical protein